MCSRLSTRIIERLLLLLLLLLNRRGCRRRNRPIPRRPIPTPIRPMPTRPTRLFRSTARILALHRPNGRTPASILRFFLLPAEKPTEHGRFLLLVFVLPICFVFLRVPRRLFMELARLGFGEAHLRGAPSFFPCLSSAWTLHQRPLSPPRIVFYFAPPFVTSL